MHFVCDKCNAKYSIPDEKIAGKILKLRCKKCSNTIVVKDPKAVASMRQRNPAIPGSGESRDAQRSDKGKQLLQNAFKKSLAEVKSSSPSPANEGQESPSEKTQIAKIPDFATDPVEEEWYLADARGQFGPMDFKELVARIKRGEPDDDAVVWKDGFDDWLLIHQVPELKPFRRHAPPPRIRQFKETKQMTHVEPPANFPPAAAAQMGLGNPLGTGQFRVDRTGQLQQISYGNLSQPMSMGNPMDSQYIIGAPAPAAKNKSLLITVAVIGLFIFIALLYVVYNMGKSKAGTAEHKPTIAAKDNTAPMSTLPAAMSPPLNMGVMAPADMNTEPVFTFKPAEMNGPATKPNTPSTGMTTAPKNMSMTKEPPVAPMPVTVSRSSSSLSAIVKGKNYAIRRCFAITVRKGQSALVSSKVTANVRVSASGSVSSVSFVGSLPPMMKSCLTRFFKGISFPKGSRTDKFSYHMHFTPT